MIQKQKYLPELRFTEFKTQDTFNLYKKHFFKDIFLFTTGKNIKQREASPEFKIPCIRYGELYHMYNEVIYEIINKTNIDKSELLFSKGDEILLPSAGEDPLDIGSASALTIDKVAIGRTINILRPKKENIYSQIYVSYYINQKLKKRIATLAKGVSISNVYNSDLKNLELILPNLIEQQKTASFLTSVDKRIQALEQKKELLEQYKKGVMQKIFSREIRFQPGTVTHNLPLTAEPTTGYGGNNSYPDWEVKKLGNICEINMGQSPDSKSYNINGVGYPLIQGNADISNRKSTPRQWTDQPTKISISGDLILTVRAPVGYVAKSNIESCIGRGVCSISANKNIEQEFIFQLLLWYEPKWVSLGQGSTFTAVSGKDIRDLKILIPNSYEEQQKIAGFLSAIDTKIEAVTSQIDYSKTFKKGLLQKMFV